MSISISKRTSWFITLPIAATAIGYLWLVFFPTARAIRETRDEIRLKQDFITQTETLHRTVAQLERDLNDVERYTQEWRRQTPAPGQLAKLFGKISEHSRQSGTTTTRFDPQAEVVLEVLHHVPVQMDVTGSYADICRLLAALENLPETVWVNELKIEKQSETGKDVKCGLKLDVFAASFKKSD